MSRFGKRALLGGLAGCAVAPAGLAEVGAGFCAATLAQYILEALRVCEAQWLETSRASNNDDLQADYGNSLLRLQLVQESSNAKRLTLSAKT